MIKKKVIITKSSTYINQPNVELYQKDKLYKKKRINNEYHYIIPNLLNSKIIIYIVLETHVF